MHITHSPHHMGQLSLMKKKAHHPYGVCGADIFVLGYDVWKKRKILTLLIIQS